MIIKLNDKIEFQTTSQSIKYPINLDLKDGGSLWVGYIKNGFDIEDLIPISKGSFPFLYDDNLTFLFEKETSKLNALMIPFPYKRVIDTTLSKPKFELISHGSIVYSKIDNFSLESFLGMYYDKDSDYLVFYNNNSFFNEDKYCILDIVPNIGCITNDEFDIVGFFAKNPLQFISIKESILTTNELKEILSTTLYMMDEGTTDKMDDQDSFLKEQLLDLLKTTHIEPFKKVFEDLYEMYYQ